VDEVVLRYGGVKAILRGIHRRFLDENQEQREEHEKPGLGGGAGRGVSKPRSADDQARWVRSESPAALTEEIDLELPVKNGKGRGE